MDGQKDNKSDKDKFRSALKVNQGVERLPVINEQAIKALHSRRKVSLSADSFVEGILSGDRTVLSQAITLAESSLPHHYEKAQEIIEKCTPYSEKSFRIGITGVPGVGKSTFIEAFGMHLISRGHKTAVLAVDPSSEVSKGSILGDKTRMETLSGHPDAFIRPSPSAGSLGGVARKTREIIILCEAAGFDRILVETVGVGQSETAVHSMVDFFLLLMLSGAGDELQGIKRGIMEMADGVAITKSDGSNIVKASAARVRYEDALHLFPPSLSGWKPKVHTCSSVTREGLKEIYETIMDFFAFTRNSDYFFKNRKDQAVYWMKETIDRQLNEGFYKDPVIEDEFKKIRQDVSGGRMSSFTAARKLLDKYKSRDDRA